MKTVICIAFFALVSYVSVAQIKLPVGFHCILGVNHPNESYFTNGNTTFKTYPWGHEGISGLEVVNVLQTEQLKFQKTKDNLYWATGKVEGKYIYIVLADGMIQFTVTSNKNDNTFSDYCTWMLKEIRREVATTDELYFTDFNGKGCFGIK